MNEPKNTGTKRDQWSNKVVAHKILLAIGDFIAVTGAFYTSFMMRNYFFAWRGGVYEATYKHLFFLTGLLLVVFFYFRNRALYRQIGFSRSTEHLETLTSAWAHILGFFIALSFFFKIQLFIEHRITVVFFCIFSWLFLYVSRFFAIPFLCSKLRLGYADRTNTLIIGTGSDAQQLADKLAAQKNKNILGFVDDTNTNQALKFPCLGTTQQLEELIKHHAIEAVYIQLETENPNQLTHLLSILERLPVSVRVDLKHFGVLDRKISFLPEVEEGIIFFNYSPLIHVDRFLKRVLDLIGASLGLCVFSIPFFILAILIKLESPGPVFFRQKRRGKDNKTFVVYKFRSMRNNTEKHHEKAVQALMNKNYDFFREQPANGSGLKAIDTQQITRVGVFLRKLSLDELPQLINVLKGEMSLVGPRPEPEYQVALYKPWHHERHKAKPGITGFWQVYGRSAVSHDDMVLMDIFYINNWSIALDLKILIRTFLVVFSMKGAV